MRHAPQARFDRVARGDLKRPAYTIEQMERWTETDWSWHIRQALHARGYNAFHIREASETGIADLIVYRNWARVNGHLYPPDEDKPFGGAWGDNIVDPVQVIECWMELKIHNTKADSNFQAGQKGFMRAHWGTGRNALFVMFDRKVGMLAAHQGDLKGRVKMLPASPYSVDWPAVFAHFKSRR